MSAVRLGLLAGAFLAADLPVPALSQETPPPYCEEKPEFDQFNFWIGEWDVFTNDEARELAGHNTVTKRSAGCLVFENWVNPRGQHGYSVNFYDPVAGTWQRQWVSNGAALRMEGGLNAAGEMVMEGEIHLFHHPSERYPSEVDSFPFRATWTPRRDGTVRKLFENYDREAGEWRVWFDGIYVPADETGGEGD